jgi:hypothetical protein
VAEVESLPRLCLRVKFVDGLEGIVDMAAFGTSDRAGVFAVLRDDARFQQVRLVDGVVTWPGELDLAPDAMHTEIRKSGTWILS